MHVLVKELQQPEQTLGDDAEHAQVDALGQLIGHGLQLGAVLGAQPVGNRQFLFLPRREKVFRLFNGGAVDGFLQQALDRDVVGFAGQHGGQEIGAHGPGPVNLARGLHARAFQGFARRLLGQTAVVVPGNAHGIIAAAGRVAGIGGHGVAHAHAAGLIPGIDEPDFFLDQIGVRVEGQLADHAQIVYHAHKTQRALLPGVQLEVLLAAVQRPLAGAPGRLAVDHQAQRRHGGRAFVHHVHQG